MFITSLAWTPKTLVLGLTESKMANLKPPGSNTTLGCYTAVMYI